MKNNIIFFKTEPYYTVNYNKEAGDCDIWSGYANKTRLMKQYLDKDGYLCVKLNNKTNKIHAIIGEHFFGKKKGYSINHKDCNKINNSLKNLEYITIAENIQHAIKNGLHVCCHVENMPTYKDGRAIKSRKKQYQHEWYERKKAKITN